MIMKHKKAIVNTKIAKELYNLLLSLYGNNEETLCLMNTLDNDNERKQIINLIENGFCNKDILISKALEFRGLGTPIEEFDGNPEDILNLDDDDE